MTDRIDETVRQDHYGTGRQAWDDIVEYGWGPAFAAGNVLKYLRRDKAAEHSLESARWYWRQLVERSSGVNDWWCCAQQLRIALTADELGRLEE
jgi:hypothetical protein